MGKNLHRTIVPYIEQRIKECRNVLSYEPVNEEDDYYIFKIHRAKPLSSFKVYLADEYIYTLNNYFSRSKNLSSGDFILLARPEATFSLETEILETALLDNIFVGKLKDFIRFLNRSESDFKANLISYLAYLKENNKK